MRTHYNLTPICLYAALFCRVLVADIPLGFRLDIKSFDLGSSQQNSLCNFANSTLPGLLDLTDESWDCSSSVSNDEICSSWYGISCGRTSSGDYNVTEIVIKNFDGDTGNLVESSLLGLSHLERLSLSSCNIGGSIPSSVSIMTNLTYLKLSYNSLSSSIPHSISALEKLQYLSIADNYINDSIPTTIAVLTKLKYLYAANNYLSGSIPSEIGQLSSLIVIDFANNWFREDIPTSLGQITAAKYFTLDNNCLSGTIPSQIGRMTALTHFTVPANYLTGSLPSSLGELTNLNTIYLSDNSFSKQLPTTLSKLVKLQDFEFDSNSLSGTFPTVLGTMKSLQSLYMSDNSFTGSTLPSILGNCTALEYFIAARLYLSGTIPSQLGRLSKIHEFNLQESCLSGTIPLSFSSMTSMYAFNLVNNKISGFSPVLLQEWESMEQLQLGQNELTGTLPTQFSSTVLTSIDLGSNSFTSTIPPVYWTFTSLQSLNLKNNDLTGTIAGLTNLTSLQTVLLNLNSFSGSIPTLSTLKQSLELLNFDSNAFTGTFPSFEDFESMTELIISNNAITGSLSDTTFDNMPSLTRLDIFTNLITGSLPTNIGALTALRYFDADGNSLSSSIPSEIGDLSSVSRLYLNDNSLTGTLPSTMGKMTDMQLLVLNNNELRGTIPSELGDLEKLISIVLNSNSFSGTLPNTFEKLTNLESIYVGDNQLSQATLPSYLSSLTNMEYLDFSHNSMSGSVPSSYSILTLLVDIDLSYNCLTGTLPTFIAGYSKLKSLNLGYNKFVGSIPLTYMNLTTLTILDLGYNLLTGTIPHDISKLVSIYYLSVGDNNMNGSIPVTVGGLANMSTFKVENNSFTGTIPTELCSISSFTTFYAANNDFDCFPVCLPSPADDTLDTLKHCQDDQDTVICDLANSTDIATSIKFSLDYTSFTVQNSQHPYLPLTLEYITVEATTIKAAKYTITFSSNTHTEYGVDYVKFCATETCDIVYGSATGYSGGSSLFPGVSSVDALTITASKFVVKFSADRNNNFWGFKFTVLAQSAAGSGWVCENGTYATGLCDTNAWTGITCDGAKVQSIILTSLGIKGTLPSSIGRLTTLTTLDLHFNAFSGTLVSSLGNLGSLQVVYLSGNKFDGTIPPAIGNLSSAYELILSGNYLTGTIPTEIGKMTALKTLTLSDNSLTGVMPSELCSIASAAIDVSKNDLSCYESYCWFNYTTDAIFGGLGYCAPTSMPTSMPTSPTSMPSSRPTRAGKISAVKTASNDELTTVVASTIGSVFLCSLCSGFILFAFFWRRNKDRLKAVRGQKLSLESLPVHKALYAGAPAEEVLALIAENKNTLKYRDYNGDTAFVVAFNLAQKNERVDLSVLTALLVESLPYESMTGRNVPSSIHDFAWTRCVQYDKYEPCVAAILADHPNLIFKLADCQDVEGRRAVDMASPRCKKRILEGIWFHKRYDIQTPLQPHHKSATCTLHIAIDNEDDGRRVALKFMKNRDEFQRELRVRSDAIFDERYVVDVIREHDYDAEGNDDYRREVRRKGFEETPYCIVMEAGERNLQDIIAKEHFAGRDWVQIQSYFRMLANAVKHMHDRGYIHGDIKTLNIMRMGQSLKLIDLDGSAKFTTNEEYSGNKYSTGFIPPEMIHMDGKVVCVRSVVKKLGHQIDNHHKNSERRLLRRRSSIHKEESGHVGTGVVTGTDDGSHGRVDTIQSRGRRGSAANTSDDDSLHMVTQSLWGFVISDDEDDGTDDGVAVDYDLLPANPAHDIWSLGVVFYILAVNAQLFLTDADGNIVEGDDLIELATWSDELKHRKLSNIKNPMAKNLISQLLMVDPARRPTINHVLSHPFLSGRQAARLAGDAAEFEIFISYRQASDLLHAEMLYAKLVAAGLKVWWDQKCLKPGEPWEEGFCKGLAKSQIFLPIFSRGAVRHQDIPYQNFELLHIDSPCDNVLLEHRLAVELRDRDLIDKIFPLFIGDIDHGSQQYAKYVFRGPNACHPQFLSHSHVLAVEEKLRQHLDKQGFGMPYHDQQSVAEIVGEITKYQGGFVEGVLGHALDAIVREVNAMVQELRAAKAGRGMRRIGDRYLSIGAGTSGKVRGLGLGDVFRQSPGNHRGSDRGSDRGSELLSNASDVSSRGYDDQFSAVVAGGGRASPVGGGYMFSSGSGSHGEFSDRGLVDIPVSYQSVGISSRGIADSDRQVVISGIGGESARRGRTSTPSSKRDRNSAAGALQSAAVAHLELEDHHQSSWDSPANRSDQEKS